MVFPGVPLYRTAMLKIQHPDNSILSTEGKELLYITLDGFIGGTGPMASYLMQQDMMNERAEIVRHSTQPICNHTWNFQTKSGSFQVMFTSQWQQFAQLHSYMSREGPRYMATASFPRTPGEVVVQMFPSGRVVGRAAQTWFSHRDSPILCSIDTDIKERDQIVIFKPQNRKLAPVLSQALPISMTSLGAPAPQPDMCPANKADRPLFISSDGEPYGELDEDRGRETTPCLTTTHGDTYEAYTKADNHNLDDAKPSAEAIEQCYSRPLRSRTQHDSQEHDLNISPATSGLRPGIDNPQGSPYQEYAEDERCIVVRPWQ
ncbi:hypothetical protein CKAH01_10760 [Colletotrichum kahawae]|uniref:Uncharacterized protein n=1 Tax=Colletotrichum kahawae TaxID=34407 RepID=A0AAD9XW30_COLKA|nr:hypothetical protein CKAH01_10760 [Colletotrichum kahawae]